ncbi:ABC transporter permease [Dyadobacter chenwenxiniae]|uniref:ABC transporter permease n=1 Tax=Dyadobacter chenwenxiniae TaxID=2906456 RepID=A0A9X1PH60_9BACT|nr:ABC transporter permease [Dyadobacter chenwenxiniae]MCF0061050.1 ABC transporter permease [Dyadobacter chenwenxiniae]UON80878.1 ABC transporter permease [Dyadobacter chenwenxiniae]
MIKNYLKIAVRNLTRNKIFSFINIAGLSLGLTCCMLIVLYTKDEVSFDRFQENKDQLFRIKVTMSDDRETRTIGSTNTIHGPSFKQEIPEIKDIVRAQSNTFVTRKGNELLSEEVLFADNNFFTVFSMPLVAGDPKTVLASVNSIVLTEEVAEKYFNTKDAVGKTIELKIGDNFEKLVVSGVAKKCPQNSSIQFGAVIPFELQVTRGWTDKEWLGFYMNTFVLLHEKADYRTVIPKLNQVFKTKSAEEISKIKDFDQKISFSLQPFLDIHLDSETSDLRNGLGRGSSPIYSYILSGIAIFILLIACINFVNLTVARSLKRAKEIGIRKVVGSQRKQLMYQFLGESFLLSFIAFSFAIILTLAVLPTFNELANKQLALSYLLDMKLVSGYFALFFITGLVAGFYPALVLSGFSPAQTLYNRTKLTQKNYLTKGLVVFQFSLSVCLVIGTIVIYSQFEYLTNKNLGYNDKNLMSFSLGRGMSGEQYLDVVKEELQTIAGIEKVGAFNGNYNGTLGDIETGKIDFGYIGVDDDFLKTLEIPIVKGRNFSKSFPSDPMQSVVVNEAFVKRAGWENPVGKVINFEWKNQKMTVIGVVKNYHYASLKDTIKPLLMTQDPNYGKSTLFLKLASGNTVETVKTVEKIFRKYVPFMPFEYQFEDAKNRKRYESEAKWKQMITLAAMLSIFVSCIGLFGLATFNAETRVKEIGIRKVLGASAASIAALLSSDFIKLVWIAIVVALPFSYYAVDIWLQDFPYRISISWWYFAVAALLAMSVAILTVGYQSLKTAMLDPVQSLRSE